MSPSPHIEPLPRYQRRIIFILSLLLFFVSVPLLVFYAIGYRFDFSGEAQNIRTVGGMYVSAEAESANIYLDEEIVEDIRLFQRAAYVQNVTAGQHRLHTQGEGIQTWVKELPVFSHLVTEASSFNMPATPTVRYISPYVDDLARPLYARTMEDERAFIVATSSVPAIFSTSSPRVVGESNPEFEFIETLFASTTEDRELLAAKEAYVPQPFSFEPAPVFATTTASTTRVSGDASLSIRQDELYVRWDGRLNDIPYYYCVFSGTYASTSERYGAHVADALFEADATEAFAVASTTISQNNKLCRDEIRIDRKWQAVIWFEFLPGTNDLVLLQLQDGIYVAEVDDRAWQNVQLLYPGDYLTMVVNNDQILVQDGDIYFELLTEPLPN